MGIHFFEPNLLNPGLPRMTSMCFAYQTQFRLKTSTRLGGWGYRSQGKKKCAGEQNV